MPILFYNNIGTASSASGYGMYSGGCQQCPQGTYTWAYGSANCLPCPEGSVCPDQTKGILFLELYVFVYKKYKNFFYLFSD